MSASSDERLVVLLEARVSEFEKRMRQAEQRGSRAYQGLRRGSRSATRQMEADMNRATTSINQALATTSTKIGNFSKAFAGGLVGGVAVGILGGFRRSIRDVLAETAGIADVADRVQIGVEALQGLQHGFQLAGFSADEFNAALTRFTRRVGEAVHGGGPLQTTLDRYGISVRRANGEMKSQMEMLREISEVIRRAGTEQEKLAIAQAAFGDVGRRMVVALKDGEDGIDGMIQAARDAGVVMDEELVRKAEEIDRKFAELSASAAAFSRRVIVGMAAAGAELVSFKERLQEIFPDEAEGRAIFGDAVYDALDESNDLLAENAAEVEELARRYAQMRAEAQDTAFQMLSMNSVLRAMGETDAADTIDRLAQELDEAGRAFRAREIDAETFTARLGEIQTEAIAVYGALDEVNSRHFGNVIASLGTLGSAIAAVRDVAYEMADAVAQAANVDTRALRDRHNAEAESMASLDAHREALEGFNRAEAERNSATSEQLRLQREIEATLKRAADAGANLTASEAEAAAKAAIAAEDARKAADREARSSGRSGGSKSGSAKLDEFEREVKAIRDRTAALETEAAVLVAVASGAGEYADALEFARQKAQLLHAAQQAGKQITPELTAEIDKLAEAYVTAGMNAEDAAQKMKQIEEQSERGKDALGNLFGSILDGSKSAKQAVADLLAEIAKVQMMRGIMGVPGIGSLAAGLGGLLSFDGGGYTGNRPRSGGLDGKGGFLAMLHPRETVTDHSKGQASPQAAGGTSKVQIMLGEGLEARILEAAAGQSVQISQAHVRQFNQALPDRINQINRNPRYR